MSNERVSGGISYAAQGAAAGAAFGPWGAAIGGVLGLAGGILGGGQAARARQMANRARKIERGQSYLDAAVARRDLIRQGREARATSLAMVTAEGEGGMASSAPMGALQSVGSQLNFNLGYFDSRIAHMLRMQKFQDRAAKYGARAKGTFGIMDSAIQLAGAASSFTSVTGSQLGGSGVVTDSVGSGPVYQNDMSWMTAPTVNVGG